MQIITEAHEVKPDPAPARPPAAPTPAAGLPTGGRTPDGPDPDWEALFAAGARRDPIDGTNRRNPEIPRIHH